MSLAAYRAAGGTFITMEATFSKDYAQLALDGDGVAMIDWGDGTPHQTVELHYLRSNEWSYLIMKYLIIDGYLFVCRDLDSGILRKITITGNISRLCMRNNIHISALDTGKMPFLHVLVCCGAGLSTLNLSKNANLKSLYIEDNAFTALDISKNCMLQYLDCKNNRLEYAALIDIFAALPDREEIDNATIVCNGNPGYDAITDADKSILSKKNWSIIE